MTFKEFIDEGKEIPLSKHTLKNKPKSQTPMEWLKIERNGGKSKADGKYYGWSHRAIYGFAVGDKVKGDSLGKKKTSDPDFVIKTEKQAEEVANTFKKNVS